MPTSARHDDSLDFASIDFRRRPERYRIGKGDQGVFLVEPYKGEILPHWRLRTITEAKRSSRKIYESFLACLEADDFVGADMARKFLQTGWTRARRYANRKGGRKYDRSTGEELPRGRRRRESGRRFYLLSEVREGASAPRVRQNDKAASGEVRVVAVAPNDGKDGGPFNDDQRAAKESA
jgi:hypothetical protein